MNKIVVIGCGNVGMSYVYALINQRVNVQEIALIDLDMNRVMGEVMDLNHGLPFAPTKMNIKAGTYEDVKDATIVMIAAGANQKPGETRMDLIKKNSVIFKDIINNVMEHDFKGIFVVATNPLDVMTHITWKYANIDPRRVIGSGTSLDTARLRYLVSNKLNIDPKNVHAYVIGEHGDSEFIPWSNANIGLQNINDFLSKEEMEEIYVNVRDAAYEIINRKGNTSYGVGMCLVKITNAIMNDENTIITVSAYDKKNDLFISTPAIINASGVERKIYVKLNLEETEKMQHSVDVIRDAITKI